MTVLDQSRLSIAATIKRATVAAHKEVTQLDAKSLKELQIRYKQAAAEIAQAITNHAGGDGNLALQELQGTLAQVNGILQQLGQQRDVLLQGALSKAAQLGTQPYLAAIDLGAATRVSQEALAFVRTFVAKDGLQLSDRLWRLDRQAKDVVTGAIEQAVIQGHGAAQAASDFLVRQLPVPADIAAKQNAAKASTLGKTAGEALFRDKGSPMDNAMRLMRTEINRAHGEAYMKGGEGIQSFAGWRFLLSPSHPEPDICDLLSTQNLYGLGPGVYPSRAKTPWPAHPNTLSFIEIVFEDEITDEDKAGKETPIQAMQRLSPERQKGVLGAGKFALHKDGKLTQGMIRTPLAKVKERLTAIDAAKTQAELQAAQDKARANAQAALERAAHKAAQQAAQNQLEAIEALGSGHAYQALKLPIEADMQLRVYMEHPELREIDRTLDDGDQVLFVSMRNRSCPAHEYRGHRRRLNRRAILEMVKRYGRELSVPENQLHPHAMRHLYGTELAEGDVDLLVRQQLMGHEDPKSTRIYDHTAIRKAVREVDRANPLAKIRTPVSDLLKRL